MRNTPGFIQDIIRPHRAKLALALVLNVIVGASVAFQNVVPKYIIDDALMNPELGPEGRRLRLYFYAALYLFIGVFPRALLFNLSLRIFGRVRERCVFELRSTFFRHVNRLCLNFHTRHQSGELFSYVFGSPLQQIQQYYQSLALIVPHQLVAILLTLLFLGAWDIWLSLLMIVVLSVYFLVLQRARLQMRLIHRDYQNVESKVSGKVSDLLRGYRAVKVHAFEDSALVDFQRSAGLIRDKAYRRDIASHLQMVKEESVIYSGFACICIVAGWRYLDGVLTAGQLTAYLTSFLALRGPLKEFFNVGMYRAGAQASLERFEQILSTHSTTPEPTTSDCPLPTRGEIRFEKVDFAYEDTSVLRGLNLTIPYGQNVALVGSSGAGKSTLIQLVLRLYDPDAGQILLGGHTLKNFQGNLLRNRFGVVPQDPYFFHISLRENLRIVSPRATEDELVSACREANAWEFIKDLPDGLGTMIGENGTTLSGGQKQRLAIARALLAQPDYFIFDEATSALDTVSEQLIRDAVARITQDKTAFFIAHRLASITHCDRILVLEHGQIVQDGTFEALSK
ncbi:MAG: ABC transporter ATP-binding protein [Kiritimatiellae bacterium]|jgi:ABC-type multidrug transport system fused ATPase/permease subunit|nr:ABC transporter ATP-binding protein [Kiritimatiellia bacterium]